MEFTRPRGTRDFLFDEMENRKEVEKTLRRVFENYAYREIKTPIFENLSLFTTKSGEQILDQLYNFEDKSNRELTLRPEITAPIARLYLNEMQKTPKPIKLYYFGSCFRYERPQKGRFRQFWQFGCENIGAKSPEAEAEIIAMANHSLNELKINDAEIHINHLGIIRGIFKHFQTPQDIQDKIMLLIDKGEKENLKGYLNELENQSKELEEILVQLIEFVGNENIIEKIEELLTNIDEIKPALGEFKQLTKLLAIFNLKNYTLNLSVARGLDYYTGIVFEIYIPSLGAQKQVAGGGTYSLIEIFGGEKIESTGFAFGFDRLMNGINEEKKEKSRVDVYVAPISENTREKSFEIGQTLRRANISVEIDLSRKKFKKLINIANKLNVKYLIAIGEKDLKENSITIKDMKTGNQELVKIEEIVEYIGEK
ncbi:histidine--tRNA ligase [Methanobrevibacter filiformis]|uniref:Histidine--tRNA ligase n=1 Tax=Methanobrevibacter filiformis TaxID=55758 RepID=A0A166C3R9_9EURY|nr:histidine--tRNA ligase [Methanobrevibacter filiformis]KZX14099.1 histidine--tRNA ligase [Methanobrevibacter filiformis]